MWLCRVRVNLCFFLIDTITEKIVRPSANQINCDFIVDGPFFLFKLSCAPGADVSVWVLHCIRVDCWCWLRDWMQKVCVWLRQSVSRYPWQPDDSAVLLIGHSVTSSTVGISTGQWTALWCSNMKKIVWLLHVLDINVGGGMRFDSWCWSAHFHLGINGNTTRISSFKCKSIFIY